MGRCSVSLAGKRVLLTGGGTGIGRATVEALAAEGAHVLTLARTPETLEETVASAESQGGGGKTLAVTADVSRPDDVQRVFETVNSEVGGLDILVVCAALGADPIHEMSEEAWRQVLDVNLVGCMACARAAIKQFETNGGGHLLFVGSISAEIKAPGESVYSATKAGIQAFAETLRKEISDKNIRISVIQPGSTATDMQECSEEEKKAAVERHEMLHADEVADAILFALTRSERADVVTLRIEPRIQKTA